MEHIEFITKAMAIIAYEMEQLMRELETKEEKYNG